MRDQIIRQPLAILGALGFISLLRSIVSLPEDLLYLVGIYQSMTRPVWEFLFGDLFSWLHVPLPNLLKDYFSMSAITGGALIRAQISTGARIALINATALMIFLWPILLPFLLLRAWTQPLSSTDLERLSQQKKKLRLLSSRAQDRELAGDYPYQYSEWRDAEFDADLELYNLECNVSRKKMDMVFSEFMAWAAILLTVGYGLALVAQ